MDYPWGSASFGAYSISSAYGLIFRASYDGVYALDWDTGKIVWKYVVPAEASFEAPYITNGQEHNNFNSHIIIADGKAYRGTANTQRVILHLEDGNFIVSTQRQVKKYGI